MLDAGLPQRPLPPTYPAPPGPPPAAFPAPPSVTVAPPAVHTVLSVAPVPSEVLLGRLLDQRMVLIGGELDAAAADRAVAALLTLGAEDARRPLTVHVTCRGGDPAAALAVHDALATSPAPVITRAGGELDGIGLLLVAAGRPGSRHAGAHARFALPAQGRETDDRAAPTAVLTRLLRGYGRGLPSDGGWWDAAQAREHGLIDSVDGSDT